MACRSFAGEALERERFGADVVASYHSGVGFAKAKANVESLNRYNHRELMPNLVMLCMPCTLPQHANNKTIQLADPDEGANVTTEYIILLQHHG